MAERIAAPVGVGAPLLDTFARLQTVNPYLQVRCGPCADFAGVPLSRLCDADDASLDEQLAVMSREYNTDIAEVLVRFFFRGFVYYLASAAVGSFVQDRRVPTLTFDACGVTFGSWGGPDAVVLNHTGFYCLPTDAMAAHPDARLAPDVATLRQHLRQGMVDVCAPLLEALRRRTRVGARAMWIMAAEACADAVVGTLPAGTAECEARVEVSALIGDATSPLRAKPEILTLVVRDQPHLALLGNDCCCNFKIPGQSYCDNCPHRSREERLASLRAWFATQSDTTTAE